MTIYIVWWSDGESEFEPVYASSNESEALEYTLEREDDNNFYQITQTESNRPTLENPE